jgi:uncharacterized protein YdiU (UPF0061 family)
MPTKDSNWNFDNSYCQLPNLFYNKEIPEKPIEPELVIFNKQLAESLSLGQTAEYTHLAETYLSGKNIPEDSTPIAQAYAGHQFGYFTMLGDGRAILLGEHITPNGERFDIQLKGAGRTKYSRNGDGLATLYSMLREYIMSEAMHQLGIPTTRSLAVVKNGLAVHRETVHEGAVLTRIAASHIRTGTFEYALQFGSQEELKQLIDYVIDRHYPEVRNSENPTLDLLKAVMLKQIDLIVNWIRVGFIHGVMNTDNMSIPGETIDYGPCAFMNAYNPKTVFSSIDRGGRYAFGNQPNIALWNVSVLAGTLLPFIHEDEEKAVAMAKELLETYEAVYKSRWNTMMFKKIGIVNPKESDLEILNQLLDLLNKYQPDYTMFFIQLETEEFGDEPIFAGSDFKEWHGQWKTRIRKGQTEEDTHTLMQSANPSVIARNHLVEEALSDAVKGNLNTFHNLLNTLKNPYKRGQENLKTQLAPAGFDAQYQTFCGT